jgi:hypothetical protein
MGDERRGRFVDDLLDASLRRYRSGEPRLGLENRILAGVRTRSAERQRGTWIWGLAGVAAAVCMAAIVIYISRRQPAPARAPSPVATRQPAPPVVVRQEVAPILRPTRHVRRAAAAPRRPEQFPTPAPLSEQEKLLLLYVSEAPQAELEAPIIPNLEPLRVAGLRIAPIEIGELLRPGD